MSERWAHFEDAALGGGFAQVPNVVMRDGSLSMQAKYLYGLLLSYAWQNDRAHPGVKRLCDDAGVGKDTLAKYMHELADARLIEVKRRGRGLTNLYIFKALSRRLESDTGSVLESDTGSHPDGDTGSDKEYSVTNTQKKKSVEANASSGKPQSVGLEKYIVDNIYQAMREARLRLPNEHFAYHLGRAKDVLEKDEPTEAEIEALPDAFVDLWTIKGKADAHSALMEYRRQKARPNVIAQNSGPAPWEPINPHSPRPAPTEADLREEAINAALLKELLEDVH